MGSILTRTAILTLGYVYPAYMCFQILETNKPRLDQLQLWCQYWIIMALLTAFERLADTFVSWFPFYSAGKVAFIVYLWHPQTKGTAHVYETFIKPIVSRHTQDVDQNWAHLRSQTVEIWRIYLNKSLLFAQSKFSDRFPLQTTDLSSQPVLAASSVFNPAYPRPAFGGKTLPGIQKKQGHVLLGGDGPLAMLTRQAVAGQQLAHEEPEVHRNIKLDGGLPHTHLPTPIQRKRNEETVDGDFELLDANEVPALVSKSVKDAEVSNKAPCQWWWQRQPSSKEY